MSTQKDIKGARKQQTSGLSRRALIASGVATAGLALTTPAFGASRSTDHEKDKGLIHQKPPTAKNHRTRIVVQQFQRVSPFGN
jgi:hypothetical protein